MTPINALVSIFIHINNMHFMQMSQLKVAIEAAVKATKPSFTLPVLTMNTQLDKDDKDKVTEYVSHWDDTQRVRITMHREIMDKLKKEPQFAGLAFKAPKEIQPSDPAKSPYLHVVIITPESIEAVF